MENGKTGRNFAHVKRAVIKIGSGVLTKNNGLNTEIIEAFGHQIHLLREKGTEVILVSSGAIAAGVKKMGFDNRPDGIRARQAAAALGQTDLILAWEHAFSRYNSRVAQVLLTRDDLSHRRRYLNSRNTINKLLEWRIIPVINENDTVMVEEIKLGDNDNLGAMMALLMDADILINLTDIDGLYTSDPRVCTDAELIHTVTAVTREMETAASGIPGNLGQGGMLSKVKAAKKLSRAGVPMVVAGGLNEGIITDLFAGREIGTYFLPGKRRLNSRKCWIAYNLKTKGDIRIDDGARKAVVDYGRSLLPIGITSVKGEFRMGDPVLIKDRQGGEIGTGLVNYSTIDICRIMGRKTAEIYGILGQKPFDEVVHADNLAIISEQGCEK